MSQGKLLLINLTALVGFLLDRFLKNLFLSNPQLVWQPTVGGHTWGFFDGRFWLNSGAVFGLPVPAALTWALNFLIIIVLAGLVFFLYQSYHQKNLANIAALTLIILGAYSNLLDRLLYGGVVDYLNFNFWPIFNLADTMITVGVAVLAIQLIQNSKFKIKETNTVHSKEYFLQLKGKNAEEFIHNLALKSFLTDWCYLNPLLPDGKELCDLLVIFDDTAIIWQVKDLKSNKKSEAEKNLKQLAGAKRRLIDLKRKITLKNPRRGEEEFDATQIKNIYLISALLGENGDLLSFFEEFKNNSIHVFNKDFTEIVLNELDTVSDFTEYLRIKENFLKQEKTIIIMGGEEELLAYYLMNNRNFNGLNEANNIMITDGSWRHLQSKPEYKAKKQADEISYFWDSIINRAHEGSKQYELVARELARPNRFQRRFLSKIDFEAHKNSHLDTEHPIYRRISVGADTTYCFLFMDDVEPREKRRAMLGAICLVAREIYKQNKKVIGIATEKKINPTCCYDFCLMNIPEWDQDLQKQMEELQNKGEIFLKPEIKEYHEQEYPKTDYQN